MMDYHLHQALRAAKTPFIQKVLGDIYQYLSTSVDGPICIQKLNGELAKRGLIISNGKLKQGGYHCWLRFLRDQPFLVVGSFNADSWAVRLRGPNELKKPLWLMDVKPHFSTEPSFE